ASSCFHEIKSLYLSKGKKHTFQIFCGTGNNGGDGLVIARLLINYGIDVEIFIVKFSDKTSEDFDVNFDRLQNIGAELTFLTEKDYSFTYRENAVIVDAIFGSGLNRPIDNFISKIVGLINQSK